MVDAWGPRRVVSIFLAIAAIGSMLMGLTDSIYLAIVGRVMVGLGVSTIFVSNFKLLTEWFSARRMVVIGGLFIAVGGIGVLAASSPLAFMSDRIGWQGTLVAIAILTAFMAVIAFLVIRDRLRTWAGPTCGKTRKPNTNTDATHSEAFARSWPQAGYGPCAYGRAAVSDRFSPSEACGAFRFSNTSIICPRPKPASTSPCSVWH